MNKSQVFAELRKRGIAKVVVGFSGGGDEGGCDGITLFNGEGVKIGVLEEEFNNEQYDPATKKWVRKELSGDAALSEALCKPVYDKYCTFAGEFHVHGEVVWDVDKGEAKMSGSESVSHDEEFEDDF